MYWERWWVKGDKVEFWQANFHTFWEYRSKFWQYILLYINVWMCTLLPTRLACLIPKNLCFIGILRESWRSIMLPALSLASHSITGITWQCQIWEVWSFCIFDSDIQMFDSDIQIYAHLCKLYANCSLCMQLCKNVVLKLAETDQHT